MDIATFVAQRAGLSIADALGGPNPPIALSDDGEGVYISKWEVEDKPQPSSEDIASAQSKPAPAPVPEEISRRQFYQQLAVTGDVTEDEALDAAAGIALPSKIATAIASLPQSQQFSAKMLLRSAAVFDRSNPMVPVIGKILQKDDAALDALWSAAAQL